MSGFNSVTLLGRLGQDPEQKATQGGTVVATFSIATSRKRKGSDGNATEETQWHRCKAFGRQAEVIAGHVQKGDLLLVQGRIEYWKAKSERGGELSIAEIVVEQFEFAGGGRGQGGGQGAAPVRAPADRQQPARRAPEPAPAGDFADDDIPF